MKNLDKFKLRHYLKKMKNKEVFNARLLQMQIEMESIKAEIAGMLADNELRSQMNHAPAWDGAAFRETRGELATLVAGIDNLINEHKEDGDGFKDLVIGISHLLGQLSAIRPKKAAEIKAIRDNLIDILSIPDGWVKAIVDSPAPSPMMVDCDIIIIPRKRYVQESTQVMGIDYVRSIIGKKKKEKEVSNG